MLGLRRAKNTRDLADQLRRERLVPLRTWALPDWAASPASRVHLKDQGELHTQLSQLLTRGVPLVEALDVCRSSVSPRVQPRVARLRDLVASGTSFADGCAVVEVFDPVTIAVYRAAERTGDLGGAAKQLSSTVRRQLAISGKVGTLLVYPAIVASIGALASFGMVTFIVPRIGEALRSANVPLPWITEIVVNLGTFFRNNLLWVFLSVGVVVAAVVGARKIIGAASLQLARRLPLLREVILAQESARFFTVMAAMTRSGITLGDALAVAAGAINHPVLRQQLTTLRTRLIEGGVLRQLIDSVTALPLPTRRLLIAAERSGDLEAAFETLATDTTEELDRRTTRLTAALEPILIVILALFIGSLVLAIMIPLLKMSSQALG